MPKYSGSGWKKFEFPPNMIDEELKNKNMQLTKYQIAQVIKDRYRVRAHDAREKRDIASEAEWKGKLVSLESKAIKESVQDEFVKDFISWLQGRSPWNAEEFDKVEYDPVTGRPTNRKTVPGTPWGNQPLTVLPGVCEFLDQGVDRRSEVIKYLTKLKMRQPADINECWIYFKYLIRGVGLDEHGVKEVEDYAQFDYPDGPNGPTGPFHESPPLHDATDYRENWRTIFDVAKNDPGLFLWWVSLGSPPAGFIPNTGLFAAYFVGGNVFVAGANTYYGYTVPAGTTTALDRSAGYAKADFKRLSPVDQDIMMTMAYLGYVAGAGPGGAAPAAGGAGAAPGGVPVVPGFEDPRGHREYARPGAHSAEHGRELFASALRTAVSEGMKPLEELLAASLRARYGDDPADVGLEELGRSTRMRHFGSDKIDLDSFSDDFSAIADASKKEEEFDIAPPPTDDEKREEERRKAFERAERAARGLAPDRPSYTATRDDFLDVLAEEGRDYGAEMTLDGKPVVVPNVPTSIPTAEVIAEDITRVNAARTFDTMVQEREAAEIYARLFSSAMEVSVPPTTIERSNELSAAMAKADEMVKQYVETNQKYNKNLGADYLTRVRRALANASPREREAMVELVHMGKPDELVKMAHQLKKQYKFVSVRDGMRALQIDEAQQNNLMSGDQVRVEEGTKYLDEIRASRLVTENQFKFVDTLKNHAMRGAILGNRVDQELQNAMASGTDEERLAAVTAYNVMGVVSRDAEGKAFFPEIANGLLTGDNPVLSSITPFHMNKKQAIRMFDQIEPEIKLGMKKIYELSNDLGIADQALNRGDLEESVRQRANDARQAIHGKIRNFAENVRKLAVAKIMAGDTVAYHNAPTDEEKHALITNTMAGGANVDFLNWFTKDRIQDLINPSIDFTGKMITAEDFAKLSPDLKRQYNQPGEDFLRAQNWQNVILPRQMVAKSGFTERAGDILGHAMAGETGQAYGKIQALANTLFNQEKWDKEVVNSFQKDLSDKVNEIGWERQQKDKPFGRAEAETYLFQRQNEFATILGDYMTRQDKISANSTLISRARELAQKKSAELVAEPKNEVEMKEADTILSNFMPKKEEMSFFKQQAAKNINSHYFPGKLAPPAPGAEQPNVFAPPATNAALGVEETRKKANELARTVTDSPGKLHARTAMAEFATMLAGLRRDLDMSTTKNQPDRPPKPEKKPKKKKTEKKEPPAPKHTVEQTEIQEHYTQIREAMKDVSALGKRRKERNEIMEEPVPKRSTPDKSLEQTFRDRMALRDPGEKPKEPLQLSSEKAEEEKKAVADAERKKMVLELSRKMRSDFPTFVDETRESLIARKPKITKYRELRETDKEAWDQLRELMNSGHNVDDRNDLATAIKVPRGGNRAKQAYEMFLLTDSLRDYAEWERRYNIMQSGDPNSQEAQDLLAEMEREDKEKRGGAYSAAEMMMQKRQAELTEKREKEEKEKAAAELARKKETEEREAREADRMDTDRELDEKTLKEHGGRSAMELSIAKQKEEIKEAKANKERAEKAEQADQQRKERHGGQSAAELAHQKRLEEKKEEQERKETLDKMTDEEKETRLDNEAYEKFAEEAEDKRVLKAAKKERKEEEGDFEAEKRKQKLSSAGDILQAMANAPEVELTPEEEEEEEKKEEETTTKKSGGIKKKDSAASRGRSVSSRKPPRNRDPALVPTNDTPQKIDLSEEVPEDTDFKRGSSLGRRKSTSRDRKSKRAKTEADRYLRETESFVTPRARVLENLHGDKKSHEIYNPNRLPKRGKGGDLNIGKLFLDGLETYQGLSGREGSKKQTLGMFFAGDDGRDLGKHAGSFIKKWGALREFTKAIETTFDTMDPRLHKGISLREVIEQMKSRNADPRIHGTATVEAHENQLMSYMDNPEQAQYAKATINGLYSAKDYTMFKREIRKIHAATRMVPSAVFNRGTAKEHVYNTLDVANGGESAIQSHLAMYSAENLENIPTDRLLNEKAAEWTMPSVAPGTQNRLDRSSVSASMVAPAMFKALAATEDTYTPQFQELKRNFEDRLALSYNAAGFDNPATFADGMMQHRNWAIDALAESFATNKRVLDAFKEDALGNEEYQKDILNASTIDAANRKGDVLRKGILGMSSVDAAKRALNSWSNGKVADSLLTNTIANPLYYNSGARVQDFAEVAAKHKDPELLFPGNLRTDMSEVKSDSPKAVTQGANFKLQKQKYKKVPFYK